MSSERTVREFALGGLGANESRNHQPYRERRRSDASRVRITASDSIIIHSETSGRVSFVLRSRFVSLEAARKRDADDTSRFVRDGALRDAASWICRFFSSTTTNGFFLADSSAIPTISIIDHASTRTWKITFLPASIHSDSRANRRRI